MKILVLSDSHGVAFNIIRALDMHRDADVAIFLGDGASDFLGRRERYPNIAFLAVAGNNDIGAALTYGLRRAEEITLEGKKIFYTHGNNYAVDFGLGNIISAARSRGSDIVLFGHTHKPLEKYIPEDEEGGALYLVNPGSIGGVRAPESTYAIITIEGDDVLISHGKL